MASGRSLLCYLIPKNLTVFSRKVCVRVSMSFSLAIRAQYDVPVRVSPDPCGRGCAAAVSIISLSAVMPLMASGRSLLCYLIPKNLTVFSRKVCVRVSMSFSLAIRAQYDVPVRVSPDPCGRGCAAAVSIISF